MISILRTYVIGHGSIVLILVVMLFLNHPPARGLMCQSIYMSHLNVIFVSVFIDAIVISKNGFHGFATLMWPLYVMPPSLSAVKLGCVDCAITAAHLVVTVTLMLIG